MRQENAWRDKIHPHKRMDERKKKEKYPHSKRIQQQWNEELSNEFALDYF